MFFHCRVQVLGIVVALPQSLFYPLLVVALIWTNGLSIMEEILDIGQEETIDHHPMPDVPKNTTCPTSDGFESDSVSGNGALVQPEFQLQHSSPSTFFLLLFFIHSLFGKPKKMKQTKFCVLFWKLKGSNKGIGRDRSQVFQQWRRRFRAFNGPHFCQ